MNVFNTLRALARALSVDLNSSFNPKFHKFPDFDHFGCAGAQFCARATARAHSKRAPMYFLHQRDDFMFLNYADKVIIRKNKGFRSYTIFVFFCKKTQNPEINAAIL